MLIASLIVSAILLAVTNAAAGTDGRRAGLGGAVALVALVLFFMAQSLVLTANALALLIAAVVCACLRPRPAWFLKASLLATGFVYAVAGAFVCMDIRENLAAREQFPYESLASRLFYESPGRLTAPEPKASPARLDETEREIDHSDYFGLVRTITLRHIHAGVVEQFINSPGFGVARQFRAPNRYFLPAPHSEPIVQPAVASSRRRQPIADAGAAGDGSLVRGLPEAPPKDSLLHMHDHGVADFVNPRGFGDARDRDHVAGFQEHLFRETPEPRAPAVQDRAWQVARLDLVSLLKFDEPCAYVSEHLPRMDELRGAPTRPLDAFEKESLTKLQAGEDLAVEAKPDRIRMVGAVRALKQCLACHEARRGDLLGAFSYVLRPDAGEP